MYLAQKKKGEKNKAFPLGNVSLLKRQKKIKLKKKKKKPVTYHLLNQSR